MVFEEVVESVLIPCCSPPRGSSLGRNAVPEPLNLVVPDFVAVYALWVVVPRCLARKRVEHCGPRLVELTREIDDNILAGRATPPASPRPPAVVRAARSCRPGKRKRRRRDSGGRACFTSLHQRCALAGLIFVSFRRRLHFWSSYSPGRSRCCGSDTPQLAAENEPENNKG